jgi:ElaB/YqjD/DUF883 family membrane-anchored ribosome-binding protein
MLSTRGCTARIDLTGSLKGEDVMEATHNPNRIGDAARKLKDGASEFTSAVADKGAEVGSAALQKGSELTRTAMEKASDFKNAVVEKSQQAYERARDGSEHYIKENPHSSVLYALGIGAVIGALTAVLIVRARD